MGRFVTATGRKCPSRKQTNKKKTLFNKSVLFVLAPPIFPGRRQPSIVGRNELNYRVRNGNGWTLVLISTNYLHPEEPETFKL